jgi:hypothetical protein
MAKVCFVTIKSICKFKSYLLLVNSSLNIILSIMWTRLKFHKFLFLFGFPPTLSLSPLLHHSYGNSNWKYWTNFSCAPFFICVAERFSSGLNFPNSVENFQDYSVMGFDWHSVIWWVGTTVLEDHVISMFGINSCIWRQLINTQPSDI